MRRAWPAAVLILAACGGPAPEEFPVGFFGVETAADARLLCAKGYNAIQTYSSSPEKVAPTAAAARREGMLMLASPREIMTSTWPASGFPGTWWYLQDEPEIHGISREELAAFEARVRAWSPGSRSAFVVGDGTKAKDYPGVADAIMVDWYPVPHLPLESAGDHVRLTAQAAGGRKVWAVLQAMDWRDFPQRDRKKPRIGRFPDLAEIRFMSYDAVLGGAQGVWYFVYTTSPGVNLSQKPELLFAVDWTARELRAMAPVFVRGAPMPLPFATTPDGPAARMWRYRGRDYLVLANRRSDVKMKVPKRLLTYDWRPLFEPRRDPKEALDAHHGAFYLRPHQVLVLESRYRWLLRLLGR